MTTLEASRVLYANNTIKDFAPADSRSHWFEIYYAFNDANPGWPETARNHVDAEQFPDLGIFLVNFIIASEDHAERLSIDLDIVAAATYGKDQPAATMLHNLAVLLNRYVHD